MTFPIIDGGVQRLGESKKNPGGGGRLGLCQGGPRVDPIHRGGHAPPPGEKTMGINYPSGHIGDPVQDGTEGSGALGGESPLHASRGARGSGSPVLHTMRSEPWWSGTGMAVARISFQDLRLAVASAAGGGQAYSSV